MTTETQVAPVAETQTPATELTQEVPQEVVTPDEVVAEHADEPAESEDSKSLKRMQRRIDKRTADLYRERAEKDQLAQRLAEVERRLQPAADETQPNSTALEKDVLTRAQQLAQEMTQQQKVTDSVGSVLKAGKALPGFDAACNAVAEDLPFYDDRGKPTAFLSAVLEFDAPAQLLHHLGTHPDLAAELADLTPTQQVRRLDRIERELTSQPKTSSAPKPLAPVKPSAPDTSLSSAKSDEEWARMRDRELAERRRNR